MVIMDFICSYRKYLFLYPYNCRKLINQSTSMYIACEIEFAARENNGHSTGCTDKLFFHSIYIFYFMYFNLGHF